MLYNLINGGGEILNLDGPLELEEAIRLADEIEEEHNIWVAVVGIPGKPQSQKFTIRADQENNGEVFWANFRRRFPEIAAQVAYQDFAIVEEEAWRSIQQIEGFADGPEHAQRALLAESTTVRDLGYSISVTDHNERNLVEACDWYAQNFGEVVSVYVALREENPDFSVTLDQMVGGEWVQILPNVG